MIFNDISVVSLSKNISEISSVVRSSLIQLTTFDDADLHI